MPGVIVAPIEAVDVVAHVRQRHARHRLAGEALAALAEDPRIPDGMAADHDACRAGVGEDGGGALRGRDVAVRKHRAADRCTARAIRS